MRCLPLCYDMWGLMNKKGDRREIQQKLSAVERKLNYNKKISSIFLVTLADKTLLPNETGRGGREQKIRRG